MCVVVRITHIFSLSLSVALSSFMPTSLLSFHPFYQVVLQKLLGWLPLCVRVIIFCEISQSSLQLPSSSSSFLYYHFLTRRDASLILSIDFLFVQQPSSWFILAKDCLLLPHSLLSFISKFVATAIIVESIEIQMGDPCVFLSVKPGWHFRVYVTSCLSSFISTLIGWNCFLSWHI